MRGIPSATSEVIRALHGWSINAIVFSTLMSSRDHRMTKSNILGAFSDRFSAADAAAHAAQRF